MKTRILTTDTPQSAEGLELPAQSCSPYLFRAGDIVKHRPTEEEWVLAHDETETGYVSPCGWPPTLATAKDCEMVTAADDGTRLDMLKQWAGNVASDHRTREARNQLSLESA